MRFVSLPGIMEDSTTSIHRVRTPEEEQHFNTVDSLKIDPLYDIADHGCQPDVHFDSNPSYGVQMKPRAAEKVTKPSQSVRCLSIVVVFVLVCVCISLAVAVWSAVEVRKVSSNSPNSMQDGVTANITVAINFLQNQLDTLQNTNSLLNSLIGQLPSTPASSCLQVSSVNTSGYYWVRASNGSAVHVYCDMTRSCGGVTGGWTRVAYLQFQNGSDPCPDEL